MFEKDDSILFAENISYRYSLDKQTKKTFESFLHNNLFLIALRYVENNEDLERAVMPNSLLWYNLHAFASRDLFAERFSFQTEKIPSISLHNNIDTVLREGSIVLNDELKRYESLRHAPTYCSESYFGIECLDDQADESKKFINYLHAQLFSSASPYVDKRPYAFLAHDLFHQIESIERKFYQEAITIFESKQETYATVGERYEKAGQQQLHASLMRAKLSLLDN